ncbi:MAG: bifunctional shikimate kinase/3-dehydroquinate synthase [Solirubrobacteraceae bacterium]
MALVLIGFMGAGKSTAARELGGRLGADALDSDTLLSERFGHPVAREFELHGEEAFRAAEQELVCELLARAGDGEVIALGGGSVLSESVRAALAGHVVVLLDADAETAWGRVHKPGEPPKRPLAADHDEFVALHEQRRPLYERLADAFVPSAESALAATGALQALGLARREGGAGAKLRMVWAHSRSGEYPVWVGRGLLGEAGGALQAVWPVAQSSSRGFCVSDEHVRDLYAHRLGGMALTLALAPGEQSKTLAQAELVWEALAAAGMTRADHLVALGGGVVGDLAGFCAATYQRGVPFVQVPTTLVAQVDSAYGGKTGVDLPQAKNYVGAYHQPVGVIVDPQALETLPAAELAAGWVEVLKTALIAGGALWEAVRGGALADENTILACARTKLATVAADERDEGRRQVLNLGHTVGHAIETATGYERYRHGEAVGLGLLAALRLSGQDELRAQVSEMLRARGLPVELKGADLDTVLAAVRRDQKRIGADVPFVLVDAPGDVSHGRFVADEQLRAAVAELAR